MCCVGHRCPWLRGRWHPVVQPSPWCSCPTARRSRFMGSSRQPSPQSSSPHRSRLYRYCCLGWEQGINKQNNCQNLTYESWMWGRHWECLKTRPFSSYLSMLTDYALHHFSGFQKLYRLRNQMSPTWFESSANKLTSRQWPPKSLNILIKTQVMCGLPQSARLLLVDLSNYVRVI